MSNNQDGFAAEKASRSGNMIAMLLVVMAVGAALLHNMTMGREKTLMQVTASASQQAALVARIGMLTASFLATHDEGLLSDLKQTGTTALSNHEQLAPLVLAAMARGMNDEASMRASSIDKKIRELVTQSFIFAGGPTAPEAQATAESILTLSRLQIPDAWKSAVDIYAASSQQELDMLSKASFGLYGAIAVLALYLSSMILGPAVREIIRQRAHIEQMGSTDMLTGFYNRAMLFKVVATLISGAKRHKHPLTALAVDIDDFKSVNEKFGRAAGDNAIRTVSRTLAETLRNSDVIGRVAGQEFGIFLPSTDEYRATFVAEKLRAAVEALPFSVKDTIVLLRVSIGIAELQPAHKNTDDLLRAAEAALTLAKDGGRNRVATFSGQKAAPPAAPAPEGAQA